MHVVFIEFLSSLYFSTTISISEYARPYYNNYYNCNIIKFTC